LKEEQKEEIKRREAEVVEEEIEGTEEEKRDGDHARD